MEEQNPYTSILSWWNISLYIHAFYPQYIPINLTFWPWYICPAQWFCDLEVFLPAPEVEVTKALDLDLPEGHGGFEYITNNHDNITWNVNKNQRKWDVETELKLHFNWYFGHFWSMIFGVFQVFPFSVSTFHRCRFPCFSSRGRQAFDVSRLSMGEVVGATKSWRSCPEPWRSWQLSRGGSSHRHWLVG